MGYSSGNLVFVNTTTLVVLEMGNFTWLHLVKFLPLSMAHSWYLSLVSMLRIAYINKCPVFNTAPSIEITNTYGLTNEVHYEFLL